MTMIEPKVIFTKADVECIKMIADVCRTFDFDAREIIDAVEDRCGLGSVAFEFLDE